MSKKYKQYLWKNESLPIRTFSRYRSDTKSIEKNVHDETADMQSVSSDDSSNKSEVHNDITGGESSFNSSVLSDISEQSIDDENSSENCFSLRNDLQELIKDGDKPLYESADVTSLEAFVSILAFSVKFNLSKTCLDGLLKLLKTLLPPCNLPETKYLFYKNTKTINNLIELHLYCPHCDSYICKLCHDNELNTCLTCSEDFNADELVKKGNFYMYMPLSNQLKVKFENEDLNNKIRIFKSKFEDNSDSYRDIVDGDLYRSVVDLHNTDNLSIQFNVDGIPLYRKSKYDIWPIQVIINELEPSERKKNIMMCGLWFGIKKPNMNEFLVPFVEELKTLQGEGLKWKDTRNGRATIKTTKVFTLICTSDAPARCAMQNFKQFNGKFGCGFCEQEGERVTKGKGHCRIYPFDGQMAVERTFESCVQNAEEALSICKPVKGVKGTSILMELYPSFNLVNGFIPDYMHCVLLGATRQLACLFVESSGSIYSLNAQDIRRLDMRIQNMKLPHEATRTLRTTDHISFWKASEWRIFLLTSPALLKNILNPQVYKHWLLFVNGITLLLGRNITKDDVTKADNCLKRFVSGVKDIYGVSEQSYNIHLLLHLPATVRAWGPLWANSCFIFEDAIGKIKMLHHGTKSVPMQIASTYTSKSLLGVLSTRREIKNHQILKFIEELTTNHIVTKKATAINGCILYGKPKCHNLLRTEERAIKKLLGDQFILSNVQFYKRMFYSGHIFSCKNYSSKFIHGDYAVTLTNKKCAEIHHIVVLNGDVYFVGADIPATKFLMCFPQVGPLCSNILTVTDDDAQYKSKDIAFRPIDVVNKYTTLPITEKGITYYIPINVSEY